MQTSSTRAARRPLAYTATIALSALAVLTGCADDQPATTAPPMPTSSNLLAGQVVTVTNALGSGAFGSLQWAVYLAANEGDTIRFDPSLAGDTIFMDTTLALPKYVTIEGPRDKGGISISGRGKARVMNALRGMTLRNVTVMDGSDPVVGGINSVGPLTIENSAVMLNGSLNGVGGIYVGSEATLINTLVSNNTTFGPVAGIAYPYSGKLTLINTTIYNNGPGRGIGPYFTAEFNPRVTLSNSILDGNGDRLFPSAGKGNCYDTRGFTRLGVNIADDQTCGTGDAMKILNWGDVRYGGYVYGVGPSAFLSLYRDSPAINAGRNCSVTIDQRYATRDSLCDIGAYEFTDFNVVTLTISPEVSTSKNGGPTYVRGTVMCSHADTKAQTLRVDLTQDQKVGKTPTTVQATTDVSFTCDKTKWPWSVALTPSSGAFVAGAAVANVRTVNTPVWYNPSATSSPVKIAVARR